MTVHELHKINLPCDGKRSLGLAGKTDLKAGVRLHFQSSLFFPTADRGTWSIYFTNLLHPPPHYQPHRCCLITPFSLQSDKQWGTNNFSAAYTSSPSHQSNILQSSTCPLQSHWCEEHGFIYELILHTWVIYGNLCFLLVSWLLQLSVNGQFVIQAKHWGLRWKDGVSNIAYIKIMLYLAFLNSI